MQAASLEILEKADVPPAQARAIAQAIEIAIAGARHTLPTKHDVPLRTGSRAEMTDLRADIRATAISTQRFWWWAVFAQTVVLLEIAYFFVTHAPR